MEFIDNQLVSMPTPTIRRKGNMGQVNNFFKNKPSDKIWWVDSFDRDGVFEFSFDKKTIFNLFADYPNKLTPEQKDVFDKENPFWKEFFSDGKHTPND